MPRSADNVGVFEPATSALSIVDISASITGTNKYAGGVLAPNGKLYFAASFEIDLPGPSS